MDSTPTYYQHKETFNVMGSVLGLAFGTAAAVPLAFVYSYLARYIPFIYLNWLISFGAVLGVAFAYVTGERMGKNRNRTASLVSALLMSVITLYIFWAAFLHVLTKGGLSFTHLVFHPKDLMRAIELLVQVGWFSLKRARVHGTFYGVLLAVEALAYVGIFIGMWWTMLLKGVFCEKCNSWGDDFKIPLHLDQEHIPAVVAGLKTGDWSFIDTVTPGIPDHSLIFEVTRCTGKCPEFILLAAIKLDVIQGKDGPESTEQDMVRNLYITETQLQQLFNLETRFSTPAPPPAAPGYDT